MIQCLIPSICITTILCRLVIFDRLRSRLLLPSSRSLLLPPLQTRLQLEFPRRIFNILVQSLPQKPTTLSAPMPIKNTKVENLRIPTRATGRLRSSIRPFFRRGLLTFPLLSLSVGL